MGGFWEEIGCFWTTVFIQILKNTNRPIFLFLCMVYKITLGSICAKGEEMTRKTYEITAEEQRKNIDEELKRLTGQLKYTIKFISKADIERIIKKSLEKMN